MKIFVCHAPEVDDQMVAMVIADRLENNGIEVVSRILYGIPGGENWMNEAEKYIQIADWFIPLISNNFNESVAAKRLLLTALENQKNVLTLIIEPSSSIPKILESFEAVDITKGINASIERIVTILEMETGNKNRQFIVSNENIQQELHEISKERMPDRVFIAYSHFQRRLAKDLSELLLNNGKSVFYDAKIVAGATWRQTVQKALDDATHVVVIWTPDAAESDEVEREVSYALAQHKVIVPVLSKDIPKLPYHLHGLHYIILEDDLAQIERDLLTAIGQHKADEDIWQ